MQNYELYIILHPELTATQIDTEIDKVQKLVSEHVDAENVKVQKEGLKKLAYKMNKNATGFYTLITFDVADTGRKGFSAVEKTLNINTNVLRYMVVNQTDFNKAKAKEQLRKDPEFTHHREYNKGKNNNKQCICKYLGVEAIDYKDVEFLSQFTSPYSKIFGRERTGTSAKMHRKITVAIKRARHMAFMSFTPQVERSY